MYTKLVLFILTKLFKKYIPLLYNTDNLVSYKLDRAIYKQIEARTGGIRGSGITEMEYSYMLGQQSILKVLRDDYTR